MGTAKKAPNESYSIDHVRTVDGRIAIAGWFLDSANFETLRVVCGDRTLHVAQAGEWHQPSLDVAALINPHCNNVRFNIGFPFPNNLSLALIEAMELSFEKDGSALRLGLASSKNNGAADLINKPLCDIRLGIGIPTYNRSALVKETVRRVQELTHFDPVIFVSNDGSSDDTADVLGKIENIHVLNAPNAGIAWNKNRLLFHLHEVEKCDIILLLEDDAQPVVEGWNIDWMLACLRFGHVNFAPSWFPGLGRGNGSWHNPYRSTVLTAQCSGFSREALSYVGYIDTRFGRYGHEHVEHTLRLIRMGYGGLPKADRASATFFLLGEGLQVMDSVSNFSQQYVDENTKIFKTIQDECAYRSAWRDDDQIQRLRDEMRRVSRQ
ncbi:hypothetical protein GCM10007871_04220 [Gluconobacter roseus NBRC 3990]|nr:hypothetical protein AA3990_2631 [Gluconobacter roseus NBRC 3990]GLP92444.1 hypothetical protein GCM10007871_04220 [Gluconobacter roseus NBRC 3990]